MPSSIPNPTFLLDENVNSRLFKFLKSRSINVKVTPKSTSDKNVAGISLKEKRILVTNDEDFFLYSAEEIYCVVWLKIPQNKPDNLIHSFKKLLSECTIFDGQLILLTESTWKTFPLLQKIN